MKNEDEFFIFGGVGNEIGKQELGKDFFFDLYRADRKRATVHKLWSLPKPQILYAPTRGIIYDSLSDCIHILCFDRSGYCVLQRFNVANGKMEVVSDRIPYQGESIRSSFYLFYNDADKEFYAVCRQSNDESDRSLITIFSLGTPPVPASSLFLYDNDDLGGIRTLTLSVFILAILGMSVVVVIQIVLNRRRRLEEAARYEELSLQIGTNFTPPRENVIFLFGDLQINDNRGLDITGRFGSKVRQTFVMLLLRTDMGRGVSTEKLSASVWPDKTSGQAKNLRGVTMNHLRKLLSDVEGLEIEYSGYRWWVRFGEGLYCDLIRARRLAESILVSPEIDFPAAYEFIDILKRGPLLPSFVKYDWFGGTKIDYDDYFSRVIEKLLPGFYESKRYLETIRLADILFSIDSLSPTALRYKQESLRKTGKSDLAKAVKVRFEEEYRQLYGQGDMDSK